MDDESPEPRAKNGVNSIEVGMRLIKALTEHGRAMPLTELAARMAPTEDHQPTDAPRG